MADSIIRIQVRGSSEVVQMHESELPTDPEDILEVLRAELAPPGIWLQIALAYYNVLGDAGAFQEILQEGLHPDLEKEHRECKKDRIAILNALAAYHVKCARDEKGMSSEITISNIRQPTMLIQPK
jgi:RNA polymerase-associated protein CTR9